MESPSQHSYVIIAYDATKDRGENDVKLIVDSVRTKDGILSAGDNLLVLGVFHKVPHPMGYQTLACPESFARTNFRAMGEEVRRKVNAHASMLLPSYEHCENVSIKVKVTAGFPVRQVILQEVACYNTAWIILDRHLRRDLGHHINKIPSKVALVKDDFSVDAWSSHHSRESDFTGDKPVYSLSNIVSLSNYHGIEHSIISCRSYPLSVVSSDSSDLLKSNTKHSYANRSREHISSSDFGSSSKQEKSGTSIKGEYKYSNTSQIAQKQNKYGFLVKSSDAPILGAGCGTRTELYIKESMRFKG